MPRRKIGEHFKQTAAMKNLMKKAMLFAAAAMAFVSCQNDTTGDETINVPGFEVSVNATTSDVARSAFGDYNSTDKTYPTLWEGNEAWWIGVNDKSKESVNTITFSNGNTAANAKFEYTEAPTAASDGTYTLYAISPASAWSSYDLEKDYLRFYIARNTQTPTATSCDPASQVLFAKSEAMESADAFSVNFEHLSAYIKFSFVNVADGGVVNSVTIAAEDVNLAGRYQYVPSTGAIAEYDRLEKSITLVTESHENLWVAVAPVNLSGKTLTFSITTDKGILSKEVTMPATAKLESGKVVTFNVDMAGIEYPAAEAGENWQLITNTADLTDGEYIIVGKSQDGNVVYLPSTTTSAAPSQKVISVPGLDLTSTASFTTTLIPEDARFTFSGSASAMTIKNAAGSYLYTTGSNNGLRIGSTSGTWKIGSNPNNNKALTLMFSNTSRYVSVYQSQDWRSYNSVKPDKHDSNGASGSTFIYKLVGGNGGATPEEPETPATPVLSINPTTLSFDAAAGSKTVTCTIENEVSGVNVTATETVDWLSTSVSGKTVTITATANTATTTRTATVTIAYTGAESKTVTVNQAAAENTGGSTTTKKYVKVTSAPSDWSGKYLIVWNNGAHGTVSGKDLAKTTDVVIVDNAIESSATVDAAAVTIAKTSGSNYSLKLQSGKYLSLNANSNQVAEVTSAYNLTFEYTTSGVKISGKDTGGNTRYVLKNGDYYRAYKSIGSYVLPTLYKLSD